jgi:hypothetical protein
MPVEEHKTERVYVNMEPSLKAKLEASMIKNGRSSASQEAWFRLTKSFEDEERSAQRKRPARARK